jgi:hypothetical protein
MPPHQGRLVMALAPLQNPGVKFPNMVTKPQRLERLVQGIMFWCVIVVWCFWVTLEMLGGLLVFLP